MYEMWKVYVYLEGHFVKSQLLLKEVKIVHYVNSYKEEKLLKNIVFLTL